MNKIILFGILISMVFGCSRNPVTGKKEFSLMSESQEISMGKSYDPQIVEQYGLYENQSLQNFINAKGNEMALLSHRPKLPYEFKILDSPVVNAFAVPGGYVYFTRGIMAHFNNEAEFAGVLGHEIGHITARHSARQQTTQILTQILMIGGIIVSKDFREFADVAQQGIGLLFLSNSRSHETESDELGVEYSTKAGYDARYMAGFFNTLGRLSGDEGRLPTFLSTHPDPGDRFVKVNKMATEKQANMDVSKLIVNRNSYLKMIDGLMYGDDPKQGFVENSVFYHPVLKFQFPIPSKWKYVNSPTQFQMATEDGKAMMVLGLQQASNLEDAKNKVITDNKLTVIESTNVKVNGLNAIALLSDMVPVDQNGQASGTPLKILTYLIEYNKMFYKFHGLSTKDDFNTYFSSFQSTMKNFNVLTDQSKINRQPTLVKVVTSNKNAALKDVLNDFKMPVARHNELAILNGMLLTDQVVKGTMVKIFAGHI
ncbi:MAG: M48 family metalloprotease [Saprospiraceae bacterium]